MTHDGYHPLHGGSWGHAYQPHLPIPAFAPYAVKTLHPGIRTFGKTNCQKVWRGDEEEGGKGTGTSREERANDEPGAFGEDEEEIPQESLGRALASKSGMEEYCAAHDLMPQRPLSPLAGMEKALILIRIL